MSALIEDARRDWQQRIIGSASCVLLFLCMAFPTVPKLAALKAFLLAVVLLTIVLEYFTTGRAQLDDRVALCTLSLTIVGFFFVIRGLLAGNLGASAGLSVHVLWPVVFILWMAGLAGRRMLSSVHRTVVVATLFIGLYGCFYLLTELGILPDIGLASTLSFGWELQAFGAHEGYTQMALAGMNSLPFLMPYVMASLALPCARPGRERLWQITAWAACGFGWFTVLAGGRRALLLVMFLSLPLILIVRRFQPAAERLSNRRSVTAFCLVFALVMVLLFVGLSSIYDFDLYGVWDHFATSVDLSAQTADSHATERRQQVIALSRGWLDKPFLGAGLGASALGSIRSETTPWAYELSYLALLFQTGLLGFAAYAAGVGWIFLRGLRIVREGGQLGQMMIPMLIGCSGLLISNATNPYLAKFDALWMLFLPLAVVNYRLCGFSNLRNSVKR
jgi:O-antigen ligase